MPSPHNRRTILKTLAGALAYGSGGLISAEAAAEIPTHLAFKDDAHLTSEPFGDLRVYLEGRTEQLKGLTVGSLELKPGQTPHPPHTHPEEELLVVTEGRGEISLEGKVSKVGPGTIMYAGSNRLHGIVNTGKAPLLFYYFKWIGR